MSPVTSTDTTTKSIQLRAFDTRDGGDLFGYVDVDNGDPVLPSDEFLCRNGSSNLPPGATLCAPIANKSPANFGTEYVVIQIQNRDINPVWLTDVYLDNVGHTWDSSTAGATLDGSADPSSAPSPVPHDGTFSILPADITDLTQQIDNQITEGQTVNLVIKLDIINEDIPTSKTIRVQLNIGQNQLQEFLIESGGAQ